MQQSTVTQLRISFIDAQQVLHGLLWRLLPIPSYCNPLCKNRLMVRKGLVSLSTCDRQTPTRIVPRLVISKQVEIYPSFSMTVLYVFLYCSSLHGAGQMRKP